jgi:hypothetical protein
MLVGLRSQYFNAPGYDGGTADQIGLLAWAAAVQIAGATIAQLGAGLFPGAKV